MMSTTTNTKTSLISKTIIRNKQHCEILNFRFLQYMSRHDNIIVTRIQLTTLLYKCVVITFVLVSICLRSYCNFQTTFLIIKNDKSKRKPNNFGRILSSRSKLNMKLLADEPRLYYIYSLLSRR